MPSRIGRFRIEGTLGCGGMGTVYLGVDDHLNRRVAIKVIRPEYRLDRVRKARLLREARVLAQLNHPGVCQLHEFVEDDRADFLVLELVEGRSLRDVLAAGVDRGRALKLASQLLDVLVAVHGRGVIHRDLKPENIMVTPEGVLKVLDFGLARDLPGAESPDGAATESTARRPAGDPDEHSITSLGALIGTVGYMSPEQARGEPATAASDLYSAGLILQELLTGIRPLDRDAPPEVRLRRAMWGETAPVTGLPQDLTRLIERLKDLEPASRPAAMDAAEMLGRAIERPRRRRRQIAAAAFVVLLALFGAGMTNQYLRAERERERAEGERMRADQERVTAQQVSGFLVELFEVADPWQGRDDGVTAREIVDEGARRIQDDLRDQPLVQATLMHTLGRVYSGLGNRDAASHFLWEAAQIRSEELGKDHPDTLESLKVLGGVHRAAGRYTYCRLALEPVLAAQQGKLAPNTPEIARTKALLSTCLVGTGEVEKALRLSREALAVLRSELAKDDPELRLAHISHAYVLRHAGHLEEADAVYRQLLAEPWDESVSAQMDRAAVLNNSAYLLKTLGRYDEAEARYLEAAEIQRDQLGPIHPNRIRTLQNLSSLYSAAGDRNRAEQVGLEVVELCRQQYPEGSARTAAALVLGLGQLYLDADRLAEAEAAFREALDELARAPKPDPEWRAYTQGILAVALVRQDRGAAIRELVEESIAILSVPKPLDGDYREHLSQLAHRFEEEGCPEIARRYRRVADRQPTPTSDP